MTKEYYYVTVQGVTGYGKGYIGLEPGGTPVIMSVPIMFKLEHMADYVIERFTGNHGGVATKHSVKIYMP